MQSDVAFVPELIVRLSHQTLAGGVSTNGFWRFRSDDSTAFALPQYDDSTWSILQRQEELEIHSPTWKGYGWFRLHIDCDSALADEPLALVLTHRDAAEIYFDGKRVAAQGLVSIVSSDEIAAPALNVPIPLLLSSEKRSGGASLHHHVIAIRYSNHTDLRLCRTFTPQIVNPFGAGFTANLHTLTDGIAETQRMRVIRTIVTMIPLGILLFVAFLYAVFYIFIRRERINLYLSLFSISSALVCFSLLYRIQGKASRLLMVGVEMEIALAIAALALSLLAMYYWVVYSAILQRWWWFWLPGTILLVAGRFFLSLPAWNYLLMAFIFAGFADMLVVMLAAFRRKIEDAGVITIGSIIFLSSTALYTFLFIQGIQHILWLFAMTTYCSFLSMPITMAFYIARRFARVNDSLSEQLEYVQRLSHQAIEQEKEKQSLIERQKQELERVVDERTKELQEKNQLLADQTKAIKFTNLELLRKNVEVASEREKSDELLLNILPAPIAERLKAGEQTIADKLHDVTVLFADIAGFTRFASTISPEKLVTLLDKVFSEFDRLVEKHGAEKIKTIGDAYMAVGGLSHHASNHVEFMARLALEMQEEVNRLSQDLSIIGLTVRVGLHSGEAVAGIIGTKKLNYDLWGDTVNTASRMETHGEAGKIHCTEQIFLRLRHKFLFRERGEIRVKGKGLMHTYFLEKEFDGESDTLLQTAQMLIREE